MLKQSKKPQKPYPDFPLYAHNSGRWAKRIRNKVHYFGYWENWEEAIELYEQQKSDLHAGRKPRIQAEGKGTTIFELVNRFIHAKKLAVDNGELTERTLDEYQAVAQIVLKQFGKTRLADDIDQDDFAALRTKLAADVGLVALANYVGRIRVLFNYGWKTKILNQAPNYGLSFSKPSKKSLRIERAKKPKKLFQVTELRTLIYAAEPQLRAMVFLAANCGLGNTDCCRLQFKHLDLINGWLDYSRPKTGVHRRAKLWPETIEAIKVAVNATEHIRERVPKELKTIVFLTRYNKDWSGTKASCPISHSCRDALKASKIYRPGLSFYAIRHTFQTIGERSKDPQAVSAIMGHVDNSMAGVYREEFDDDRLIAVANYVRDWLLPRPTVG